MRIKTKTVEERFWSKVNKSSLATACWLWIASTDSNGYGVSHNSLKVVKAHRHSWELHNGPIPKGMCVLHHCDNPPCIRPDHLFLGTHADNALDKVKKGRQRALKGEQCSWAKLKRSQVIEIRQLLREGLSQAKIAKFFKVSQTAISSIKSGRFWKHA